MNFQDDVGRNWRVHNSTLREYWSWIAGTLYLLLPVDLLMTLYAAAVHGIGAEANPYIRWALSQDVLALVALNLAALVVLVGLFFVYVRVLHAARGREAWVMARSFECWVGCLLAAGLFVFANNLSVIVYGRSLL